MRNDMIHDRTVRCELTTCEQGTCLLAHRPEPGIVRKERFCICRVQLRSTREIDRIPPEDLQTQFLPSGRVVGHGMATCICALLIALPIRMPLLSKRFFLGADVRADPVQ